MPEQLSKCCISGAIHSGTPVGSTTTVAGLDAYVSGSSADKTVVFITDIFGFELVNTRLLADEYAKAGYRVLVPDFFKGDPVPISLMKTLVPLADDPVPSDESVGAAFGQVGPWLGKHGDEVTLPLIKAVLDEVKKEGASKVALVGFCWGGAKALLSAGAGTQVDAVVANHPSFTPFPEVFEAVSVPVLITVGTNDAMFADEQVKAVKEDIFPKKKHASLTIYPGARHGFSCRGDLTKEDEKKVKEEAAELALSFLAKHL